MTWSVGVEPLRPAAPRVVIADDDAVFRSGVRAALQGAGIVVIAEADNGRDVEIVGEVGDGDTGVRLAAEHQPDVVVLDLEMPGPDPEALLKALRRAAPSAALVTFSGHDPASVAGAAVGEITLHLPKTTDLAAAGRAVRDLGRRHAAS